MTVDTVQVESAKPPAARISAARVERRYALVADGPAEHTLASWLAPAELAELATWHDASRRRAWLAGRKLAKELIAEQAGEESLSAIEILSLDDGGRPTRPRIRHGQSLLPWSLSISHTGRGVLVALATDENLSIGIDLSAGKTFSEGFLRLWFTPDEQQWIASTGNVGMASFIWGAKEAIYKACNQGESFAPRAVEVHSDGRAHYRQVSLTGIHLRSWNIDSQLAVLAVVAGADSDLTSR
jgi:phosphopantetheinyl transferase